MRLILPLKLVLGNDDGQWLPFRLVVGQQWAASIAAGYLQYYQLQSKMDQLSNAAHSLVHCRLHSVQLFTGRAATQVRDRRGRKVGSQRQVGSQILFTCWEILFVVRYWDDLMMKKNVQEMLWTYCDRWWRKELLLQVTKLVCRFFRNMGGKLHWNTLKGGILSLTLKKKRNWTKPLAKSSRTKNTWSEFAKSANLLWRGRS